MFVHTPDSPTLNEDNGSAPYELGGGEKALHTPELLNSLMALAPPSFPSSYSQYQEAAQAPPSLQQTTSSLIKEGLKVTIRSRRASAGQPLFASDDRREIKTELTTVDEARRMRRRERNKVAATKCRNKKKVETQHLIVDSEVQVNQHNSLRLEIMQLLQERNQLMTALTSHLPCCTGACADSTAAALSRCTRTPPPEIPRPLSPLTPITSPDSERRPSGSSTCSWSSVGEMAMESACAYGATSGGGFPCGGGVVAAAGSAMSPSPAAAVSPPYGPSLAGAAGHSPYSLYSAAAGCSMAPPSHMMLSPPSSSAGTMAALHGGHGHGLMSPPSQPAKLSLNSPTGPATGCAMYPQYMQAPMAAPNGGNGYQYYACSPPGSQQLPAGYGQANAGYGHNYGGYGRMC